MDSNCDDFNIFAHKIQRIEEPDTMLLTGNLALLRFVPLQGGRCYSSLSQRMRLNNGSSFRNALKKRLFETEAKSGWRSWETATRPTGFTGTFYRTYI